MGAAKETSKNSKDQIAYKKPLESTSDKSKHALRNDKKDIDAERHPEEQIPRSTDHAKGQKKDDQKSSQKSARS